MLRKTAARAFGASASHSTRMPPPVHQTSRGQALSRLFTELEESLQARVDSANPDDRTARSGTAGVRVTPARALSRGMEFVMRGPNGQCRFLHPMTGLVLVTVEAMAPGGPTPMYDEIIAVHPDWGRYRAILKSPSHDGRRSGFRFTSASQLAARYHAFVQ